MGRAIDRHDVRAVDYSDNEISTVAEHLREEITRDPSVLDVATGYLTPSVWGEVGERLRTVGRFRLLLGKDYELIHETRDEAETQIQAMVRLALRTELQAMPLPTRAEAADVQGWLEYLSRPDDEVDVRVWSDGFLHAKAYLLANSAGVGSANFTAGGLVRNRELVTWRQDRVVVEALREWFERHWQRAQPYKEELRAILAGSRFGTREWTPFEVLIRALYERYGLSEIPEADRQRLSLKWYQWDAVYRLIRLLRGRARGALLADAVGLGKTFMGMGVIYHVVYAGTERKKARRRPVLLLVPASVKPMWDAALDEHGLSWACDVHTIQSLNDQADTAALADHDLVVIDEAHRLRGGGTWFRRAMDIVQGGVEDKMVLLLTATPVHTSMKDLTNLLRLLTKNQRNVWAPEIPDFDRYLERVERGQAEAFPLLDRSVVRRSRTDLVRAVEERAAAGVPEEPLKLPQRKLSHVEYEYSAGRGAALFHMFADALLGLSLAPYDLDRFKIGVDSAGDADGEPGPSPLAGLYVAGLLKRFESSLRAIRRSLERLSRVLEASGEAMAMDPPRVLPFRTAEVRRLLEVEGDEGDTDEEDVDERWERLLASSELLPNPEEYDLGKIRAAIAHDQARVAELLANLPPEDEDGKIATIARLLADPRRLGRQRVLVFSQFRDTARYLAERLRGMEGLGRVAEIDGATPAATRRDITKWFDPDQGVGAIMERDEEPRILISTDVLAEGHNLQLASAVVNFDLHWNPQVLVQRAGRVDRLNSPYSTVEIVSFVPEEGLEEHLGLIRRLDGRFHLIHVLGLGDEPITRFENDTQMTTLEQLQRIYRDDETVLEAYERVFTMGSTDYMRQPLEAFLLSAGEEAIREIPVGVQSVKAAPPGWRHGPGTFIAFLYGPRGTGETHWRFYPDGGGAPVMAEEEIFKAIVCAKNERRAPWDGDAGVIIDWDLLRRAATDVAEGISRRRATAAIQRGASERSRRVREDLVTVAARLAHEPDDLNAVLDRLEQIRLEELDHRSEYRRVRDGLGRLRKGLRENGLGDAAQPSLLEVEEDVRRARGDLVDRFDRIVAEIRQLIGDPDERDDMSASVRPEDLTLVAWERLVLPGPGTPVPVQVEIVAGTGHRLG